MHQSVGVAQVGPEPAHRLLVVGVAVAVLRGPERPVAHGQPHVVDRGQPLIREGGPEVVVDHLHQHRRHHDGPQRVVGAGPEGLRQRHQAGAALGRRYLAPPLDVHRDPVEAVAQHLELVQQPEPLEVAAVGRPLGQVPGHHRHAPLVGTDQQVGQQPAVLESVGGAVIQAGGLQIEGAHPVGGHLVEVVEGEGGVAAGVGGREVEDVHPGAVAPVGIDGPLGRPQAALGQVADRPGDLRRAHLEGQHRGGVRPAPRQRHQTAQHHQPGQARQRRLPILGPPIRLRRSAARDRFVHAFDGSGWLRAGGAYG